MDRLMDGWWVVGGWVDGWMDGRMDRDGYVDGLPLPLIVREGIHNQRRYSQFVGALHYSFH